MKILEPIHSTKFITVQNKDESITEKKYIRLPPRKLEMNSPFSVKIHNTINDFPVIIENLNNKTLNFNFKFEEKIEQKTRLSEFLGKWYFVLIPLVSIMILIQIIRTFIQHGIISLILITISVIFGSFFLLILYIIQNYRNTLTIAVLFNKLKKKCKITLFRFNRNIYSDISIADINRIGYFERNHNTEFDIVIIQNNSKRIKLYSTTSKEEVIDYCEIINEFLGLKKNGEM